MARKAPSITQKLELRYLFGNIACLSDVELERVGIGQLRETPVENLCNTGKFLVSVIRFTRLLRFHSVKLRYERALEEKNRTSINQGVSLSINEM